jgi:hypothetical protein
MLRRTGCGTLLAAALVDIGELSAVDDAMLRAIRA